MDIKKLLVVMALAGVSVSNVAVSYAQDIDGEVEVVEQLDDRVEVNISTGGIFELEVKVPEGVSLNGVVLYDDQDTVLAMVDEGEGKYSFEIQEEGGTYFLEFNLEGESEEQLEYKYTIDGENEVIGYKDVLSESEEDVVVIDVPSEDVEEEEKEGIESITDLENIDEENNAEIEEVSMGAIEDEIDADGGEVGEEEDNTVEDESMEDEIEEESESEESESEESTVEAGQGETTVDKESEKETVETTVATTSEEKSESESKVETTVAENKVNVDKKTGIIKTGEDMTLNHVVFGSTIIGLLGVLLKRKN